MTPIAAKQTSRSKIGRNKTKCQAYRFRVGKPTPDGSKHPKKRRSR